MEGKPIKKLQYHDTYNLKSMKRMKFKKVDGQWVKIDEEGEERDTSEPMPQHPEPTASSSTIWLTEDQIEEIVQYVSDRVSDHVFAHVSGCLSSLMEDAVRKIFAEQHASVPLGPTSSTPPDPSID